MLHPDAAPRLVAQQLLAAAAVSLRVAFSRRPHAASPPAAAASGVVGAVDAYRACLMLMTCAAILAVDFPAFPRRLAKTAASGTGFMDLGPGSFVFAHGALLRALLAFAEGAPRLSAALAPQGWCLATPAAWRRGAPAHCAAPRRCCCWAGRAWRRWLRRATLCRSANTARTGISSSPSQPWRRWQRRRRRPRAAGLRRRGWRQRRCWLRTKQRCAAAWRRGWTRRVARICSAETARASAAWCVAHAQCGSAAISCQEMLIRVAARSRATGGCT